MIFAAAHTDEDVFALVMVVLWWIKVLVILSIFGTIIMIAKAVLHWLVYVKTIQAFTNHTQQSVAWHSMSKDQRILSESILKLTQATVQQGVTAVKEVVKEAATNAEKTATINAEKTAETLATMIAQNPPSSGSGFPIPPEVRDKMG